jgi:DNA-binding CsgD family transcriptional regulator/tetratricopeptide (TPR) repeat protein
MDLLERRRPLELIRQRFDSVRTEGGACVVVSGEAGIGKTSLLRAFTQDLPAGTPLLWSGCEALFTPRPLGPLIDLAEHFPPSVERALQEGRTYEGLFPALLRCLREGARERVLVIEDLHWADVGTLDFVRWLARRLHDLPLLLLLSCRDEPIDGAHALLRTLAEMPTANTLRIALAPLSAQAVESLSQARGHFAADLHALTGGNPFFVTELLAGDEGAVPRSIRDAVLGALARLSPSARELARAVSLLPQRAPLKLLAAMGAPVDAASVDECLGLGMLVGDGAQSLAFRHEIARGVVHEAMPAYERTEGHARALGAWATLTRGDDDFVHRMHHAESAGLFEHAAALAPVVARRAATTGDHAEAARLLRLALDHASTLDDRERAGLLETLADELTLVNRHADAIAAREQALAVREAHADALRVGLNLRELARLHWFHEGSQGRSRELAQRAIEQLGQLGATRELALAYSTMSHLCLAGDDLHGAITWGLRTVELAEDVDDAEAMSHALNNVACAILRQRDDALAWERLARSLALAREHHLITDAARAYNNLFILSVVHLELDRGLAWAQEGLAYCEAHGIDVFAVRILIRRAFAHIVRGQWADARADLLAVSRHHAPSPMEAATHAFVAGLLARRAGEPQAAAQLEQSMEAMVQHRVEIWFISTDAARAEAAWLDGDVARLEDVARRGLARLLRAEHPWRAAELAAWLARTGLHVDASVLPELPGPYAHEIAGRWAEAAQAWQSRGCPYDQALALCSGDDDALRQALTIFDGLGAGAAAARVRELLRQRGVRGVPRGPQPRTRDDPLNLTARERQVFEWLREGASNAAIAARLHRSERTVEHHVSALLHKLGVRSRVELLTRYPTAPGAPTA